MEMKHGAPIQTDFAADSNFDRCNLFELPLERTNAHGGIGQILFRRFVESHQIAGSCNFMDFTVMPPNTSIGRHQHGVDEEEYYIIWSGAGVMRRDGEQFHVRAGDVIRNRPGGIHELSNPGPDDLRLFVFELGVVARD